MTPERIEELRRYAQVVNERVPGGEAVVAGHELLHLLRCAKVVAELEKCELITALVTNEKGVSEAKIIRIRPEPKRRKARKKA